VVDDAGVADPAVEALPEVLVELGGSDDEGLAERRDPGGRLRGIAGDPRTVDVQHGAAAVVDDGYMSPAAHGEGVAPGRRVGVLL
jgi:hypothetical protein